MFRQTDKDEELHRLEQELLEEEETPEEYLDPAALEDAPAGEAPRVYRNFSNNYGQDLRNYASDYRAYNADRTDTRPDDLSRELLEPDRPKNRGFTIFILIALAAVMIAGAALLLRIGGIL